MKYDKALTKHFEEILYEVKKMGFDSVLSPEEETIFGTRDVIVCMVLRYTAGSWLAVFRDVENETEERQKFASRKDIPEWIERQWILWEKEQRVMKYYSFDYEQFLTDYKINKATLKMTEAQIKDEKKRLIDSAVADGLDIYNVELEPSTLLKSLLDKKAEYKSYVDLGDTVFEALEERDRELLYDFYVRGKSLEQIAQRFGVMQRTIVLWKAQALQRVKQIVQPF